MVFFSSFSAANYVGIGLSCLSVWVLCACVFNPINKNEVDNAEEESKYNERVLYPLLVSVPVIIFYAYWNWLSMKFLIHS